MESKMTKIFRFNFASYTTIKKENMLSTGEVTMEVRRIILVKKIVI